MEPLPLTKRAKWMMALFILLGVILLITGYDPISDLVGKENGMLLLSGILILAIFFSPAIDRYVSRHFLDRGH